MRTATILLSVLLCAAHSLVSVAGQQPQAQLVRRCCSPCQATNEPVPTGWQKIEVEGIFTVSLPPELRRSSASGIESLYRYYSNGRMSFYFVYEPYSYLSYDSRMGEGKMNYKESLLEIGGRKAVLFTYDQDDEGRKTYHAELYVGNWAEGQVELIMSVASDEASDMKTAQTILSSVCFVHRPKTSQPSPRSRRGSK